MGSSRQVAGSRGPKVVSPGLYAMALAISCLAAAAAVGQESGLGKAASEEQAAVFGGAGTRDAGADREQATLLRSIKPKVSGNLPAPLWIKLSSAFRVARERIRTMPGCSTLFTSRGVDGLELLTRASFAGAAPERDQAACAGSAVARTEVGGRQIRLCPGFEALSPSTAALVVIHEALHNAGMSEKPADPSGLTSREIDRLVERGCGH